METNGMGNPERGRHVFTKAQCANCHQVNGQGQNVGPDLSQVAMTYSIREAIEATLNPSLVIPDRYASKIILTNSGKQFGGMAVAQSDGAYIVLQSDGKRVRIEADDIDQVKESSVSGMPNGLLDSLSPADVADLMAYVMNQSPSAVANQKSAGPAVAPMQR